MGFIDLRQWMASLEQQGELRRIKAEVDWDREIGAVTRRVLEKKGPALLFENIKGYNAGRCTKLFASGLGSRSRLALALGFYFLTRLSGGRFLVFVIFEAAALFLALGIYVRLALQRKPGAALVVMGLVLSLAGGVLQASSLSLHLVWDFNHNGLYHLVQLVGVVLLVAGLRGTLSVPQP